MQILLLLFFNRIIHHGAASGFILVLNKKHAREITRKIVRYDIMMNVCEQFHLRNVKHDNNI